MVAKARCSHLFLAGLLTTWTISMTPLPTLAHPMGNFSISHYAGIRVEQDGVEVQYLIDMAEIPTFQEIQENGIVPQADHPGLREYLARKAEALKAGILLEINGRPLALKAEPKELIFPPGAGGLPTMKLWVIYRAKLDGPVAAGMRYLRYRDGNFPERAGWKEIVAMEADGVVFASSSATNRDRSLRLSNYPTDLLNSPPQDLEARLAFALMGPTREAATQEASVTVSSVPSSPTARPNSISNPSFATATPKTPRSTMPALSKQARNTAGALAVALPSPKIGRETGAQALAALEPFRLQANKQTTPRNAFTELVATNQLGFGVILAALAVALGLGAFHALEPGHGKTLIAAYLVGTRGTARHALLLGLIVTASHTAGVFLLGAVTLYASQSIVPERLYPWLGAVSGVIIASLGLSLWLRTYTRHPAAHAHDHSHQHAHEHDVTATHTHSHGPAQHPEADGTVSLPDLLALGIPGGIIPCPAALVVLLSALSLNRLGFGLFLIVAFSLGLAMALVSVGLLMVYARQFMTRFHSDTPLFTRWLPLTSSAVITVFGMAIAVEALLRGGVLNFQL